MKLKKQEETDFSISVEDVLNKLQKVKKGGSKQWIALCPAHDDNHQSLSIGATPDGKALLHCHANCDYIDIIQELGLYQEPKSHTKKEIIAEYDYVDEFGELVHQVVRFNPKGFAQRRPDGKGGWTYNLGGVIRVLYKLPELMLSDSTVFVVEGESDVNTLTKLGFTATTNSGGAGKWLKDYNKYFRARDVVIIPDNDKAGQEHAEVVSKNIYLTANSVKILDLDYRHEKDDITDWLKTHSKEDLQKLADAKPKLILDEDELETEVGLPFYMEGELAILGAILRNGKLIHKVIKSEVNKDFYNNKNRIIVKAMVECFEEKQGIDYITVADRLKYSGKLDYIGGVEFLKSLRDESPDSTNIDDWIKAVQSKADFRRLLELGKKATKMSQGELDTPENIGDEIFRSTLNIRRKANKEIFTHIASPVSKIFTEARNMVAGEVTGISTGFKELDDITAGLQKTDFIIVAGRPSMGKALSNDYPVLTPSGWSTIGNLKIGDLVVGSDGQPKKVLGVFPQGKKDLHNITFYDGTVSESCDEHLWFVQSRQDRKAKRKGEVLPLKTIKNSLRTNDGKRNNYCVPYVAPVHFVEQEVTLHPYLLGCLIGDGSLHEGNIRFTNIDEEILQRVFSLLPNSDVVGETKSITYRIKRKHKDGKPSETRTQVNSLGLNVNSNKKFIPKNYLYNSLENRAELLKGLLDTDGYVSKGGWIEYSTVSERLATDVRELCLSLGGRCTVQTRVGKYTKNGVVIECQKNYRLRVTFPQKEFNPFHCERKKNIFEKSSSRRKNGRYITSVEFSRNAEATCILIDSDDHLFAVKDYILTHNTALAVNIAYNASKKYNVALFSLEMGREQLIKRILCSEARVDATNFRTGNLNEHEWARLANIVPEMQSCRLFIDDTPNISTVELRSKLSIFSEEHGAPDLVVVDYLQLMHGEGRENRQQDVSSISRDMKSLAKELDAPVLALSQLSRAPEARNPPIPLMSDLRESGSLEQDADVVAFMYREDYYNETSDNKGLAQVIIAKQRNGPTGTIDLAFLKMYSRFENLHKVEYGIKNNQPNISNNDVASQ